MSNVRLLGIRNISFAEHCLVSGGFKIRVRGKQHAFPPLFADPFLCVLRREPFFFFFSEFFRRC